jgi:AraC family transcriptional regulator
MLKFVGKLAGQTSADATVADLERNNPRRAFSGFRIAKTRCWGPMSVDIVDRAAGEVTCRTSCYKLTYFLSDFQASMKDDEHAQWETPLLRGNFVFRPPDTTLRGNLTAGRYIQFLQSPDIYANLASEMVQGEILDLSSRYNLHDARISQLILAIANEIDGGLLDSILAEALNTAIAVRLIRLCGDRARIRLERSSGLSRERLGRVCDYVEAHLDDRLTVTDLASVACLSPYHFSRCFKHAAGVGPQRYVLLRRLDRAKALMRRTNKPLALIAQKAGFVDQSHMTSVFRREIGVTPGLYRAELA